MDIIETCPMDSNKKCSEEKNGCLYRCKWFMPFNETDKDGNNLEKWNCAVAWVPLLQIEELSLIRGNKNIK